MEKTKILLSWSSGKDSAWALGRLQNDPQYEVVGLFTSINKDYQRVAMHAVRMDLLRAQAKAANLPIDIIELPSQCDNSTYEKIMADFCEQKLAEGIKHFAFGDLFLEDIRKYREEKLEGTGIEAVFPMWESDTTQLSKEMIAAKLQAVITCLDPRKVPVEFGGHWFNRELMEALPSSVDPCGENGEFHTFVCDCPAFEHPIDVEVLQTVERDGFVFTDLQLR